MSTAQTLPESNEPLEQRPEDNSPKECAGATAYEPPELFVIGRAVDLIQSYSSGKYSDGYTGYYWER